ncbi:phosphoribosyltransferase [Dehalogenimonas alkenigignens]|uniref:phosphoribosyltransferase n=1 Tax=Dehalogenimonas alkenigignens TaxID=1217799 RepID=UPI000D56D0F4|nr:phosphoribosyltransferase family protein [Dehalogenimonas alkenigignens]PVV84867.1 phosphoribosyl transferase [Dehalogenimonas alkenigignens]
MVYRQANRDPIFENRFDAGKQLAEKLSAYKNEATIVLAIPNGGLPIGLQVALALGAELDVVISRKIPIPLRPEGGFGAVADDGTIILNHDLVRDLKLTPSQINYQVAGVRNEIQKRSIFYRGTRPLSVVTGKTVIIVDDGLASGYTMMAAVESVRRRRPARIIVAVPVASELAVRKVEKVADRIVTVETALVPKFYVSYYYRFWNTVSDDEGLKCLKEWEMRRFKTRG